MRISTAGMHSSALAGINERNAALVRTQAQIATGRRIQTPADDPSGAVRVVELDRALAESKQYARNADVATSRLSLEEQTLASISEALQRVRELTVQANNATNDQTARQAIVAEIEVRFEEIVDLANRADANGEYLFSGFATQTQPFARSATGAAYAGDAGARRLQISPTQRVADGHSGVEVFQDIEEGNGTFVTAAAAGNTGTGVVDGGSVTNPTAWISDTYTVLFTAADTWEVRNSGNALVATGTFSGTSGTITFNGAQITVSGQPAAGDTFTLSPSGKQDVFETLANLLTTLDLTTVTGAQRAQFNTGMGTALTQLNRALDHITDVRAEVGARLSLLDETQVTREELELQLAKDLSQLRDLDYAEAISRLNVQQLGLEAAQASYARLSQLSLFDYL